MIVDDISITPSSLIAGAMIDYPRPETSTAGRHLEIVGWIIGDRKRIERVEARIEGAIVASESLFDGRSDVAHEYSTSAQGAEVSFHLHVRVLTDGIVALYAIFTDGTELAWGKVQVRTHQHTRRHGALVLVYHRVANTERDPWGMVVSTAHFADQMRFLADAGLLVSLADIESRPGRDAVAVTFDDGYVDNLFNALPVLERHQVPTTFFITAGFIGPNRWNWWDELATVVLGEGTLPSRLEVQLGGTHFTKDLGEAADDGWTRCQEWKAWTPPPTARHALFRELWERLLRLSSEDRRRALDFLRDWSGRTTSVGREDERGMTESELCALAAAPNIEIGGHTRSHPMLSSLTTAQQWEEISGGKRDVEQMIDGRLTRFAYPFGKAEHLSTESVRLASDAGFESAYCNFGGLIGAETDRWRLPRFVAGDYDGDALEAMLEYWMAT